MTSNYNTSSWRDDFELDGVHPTIAHAIHDMHVWHAADVAARRAAQAAQPVQAAQAAQPWPFPAQLIPPDRRTPPPRHPDPEEAPW